MEYIFYITTMFIYFTIYIISEWRNKRKMEITKADFEAYKEVQESGVTNMWAVNVVCDISGLERNQCIDIMKNYGKYEEQFK